MAVQSSSDKTPKPNQPEQKNLSAGYAIKPKDTTPGVVRSLLEISAEFTPIQVKINVYETPTNKIVDVRADSPQRTRFIEWLLQRVCDQQQALEKHWELAALADKGTYTASNDWETHYAEV